MRALVCHPGPAFSVVDVYRGLKQGLLDNGVELVEFNLDDRLNFYTSAHVKTPDGDWRRALEYNAACRLAAKGIEQACYEWWPHVVIIMSGFFIPPDVIRLMRERGHHVVIWGTESPYEDARQAELAMHADTLIVNDPTNLEQLRCAQPRTWYIPHSYDPAIHHPDGRKGREVDFAFVGTGYPSRVEFFEKVDWDGITASISGNWRNIAYDSPIRRFLPDEPDQCVNNSDAAAIYRSTRVAANLYRKEAQADGLSDGWAMGPREVELAACGTFFAREPRGEGDELLWMLPTFTEPAELGDIIRFYLNHPEQRRELAKQARAAVADRTFKNAAAELLRLVSG
jgi:spore maturation protein CgeB